jgi:pimeloyl-ACP methyl ester carboxylesterase
MGAESAAPPRIVLLPGAFDSAAEFHAAGFVEAVRTRGLPLELAFAELEFRDMSDRSMLERLREGPLADARRAGCATVWLAGVSLGGFLAIAFAERFPGELAGLCLIAPYLGTRLTSGEVARAGGLAHWTPGPDSAGDEDQRLWRFLRLPPTRRCPIYLGYGRDDRFADGHRLLAAALPDDAVDVVDGGHDWPAWRAVWDRFLDRWPALRHRSAAGSAA